MKPSPPPYVLNALPHPLLPRCLYFMRSALHPLPHRHTARWKLAFLLQHLSPPLLFNPLHRPHFPTGLIPPTLPLSIHTPRPRWWALSPRPCSPSRNSRRAQPANRSYQFTIPCLCLSAMCPMYQFTVQCLSAMCLTLFLATAPHLARRVLLSAQAERLVRPRRLTLVLRTRLAWVS